MPLDRDQDVWHRERSENRFLGEDSNTRAVFEYRQDPLKNAIKGNFRYLGLGSDFEKTRDYKESLWLAFFLAAPFKDQQQLSAQFVSTKIGKLECTGIAGTQSFFDQEIRIMAENRLNSKAPFGLVTSELQFVVNNGGNIETSTVFLRILKTGRNAKSEMPGFE
jgi:hypothetical protein